MNLGRKTRGQRQGTSLGAGDKRDGLLDTLQQEETREMPGEDIIGQKRDMAGILTVIVGGEKQIGDSTSMDGEETREGMLRKPSHKEAAHLLTCWFALLGHCNGDVGCPTAANILHYLLN